jgi:hypothetical protein
MQWMMTRAVAVLSGLLALAACSQVEAPQADGVCWRMDRVSGQSPKYSELARGVGNLENCAVLLEAVRLQGQASADGAYQGYFIFVDASGVSSAKHPDSFRYPIFQPPQRAQIDRDLRRLMAARGGRLPDAAELSLERK